MVVTSSASGELLGADRPPWVASARASVGNYVALTKPRIIELLLVTTLPTMLLAAGGLPSLELCLTTLGLGALAAGSANALNCYLDRDIDAIMHRTRKRPVHRGAVAPRRALVFGIVLGVLSVAGFWLLANAVAALLTAAAIAFYVGVYTAILKRRTSSNIVWGGAAGCMPVVIGWSAVTGSVSLAALVLFGVVFFWTPPHFWALAMRYREDYARAGVPMLPVVATDLQVARRIVCYAWVMVAVSLALWPVAGTGWLYPVIAGAGGVAFLAQTHTLLRQVSRGRVARPMVVFHASITYLTLVFVGVAVDVFVR